MTEPFPLPLIIRAEFAFGADPAADSSTWEWTDVTVDLLAEALRITRGRRDEQSRVSPSACSLALQNDHGRYTPDLNISPHYPDVRLGTPIRVTPIPPPGETWQSTLAADTFDRDIPDGWDQADSGQRWQPELVEAEAGASVSGGFAQIEVVTGFVLNHLDLPILFGDGDITVTLWPEVLAAGEATFISVIYRGFYRVRVTFNDSAGSVTLSLRKGGPPDFNTSVTAVSTGLTFTPGVDRFGVRIRVAGDHHQIRIWNIANPEPSGWDIDVTDADFTGVGFIGLGIETEATAAFTDFQVLGDPPPLFVGFVSQWAPAWPAGDIADGADPGWSRVAVQGNGPLRRLGQGAQALESALKRAVPEFGSVVAYWPMEDVGTATVLASGLPGGDPMSIGSGANIDLAQNELWGGSGPLPVFSPGAFGFSGDVTMPAAADGWRFDCLYWISEAGADGTERTIARIDTDGLAKQWVLYIEASVASDDIGIRALDSAGVTIQDDLYLVADILIYDQPLRVDFRVEPDGADVRYTLVVFQSPPIPGVAVTLVNVTDTIGAGAAGLVSKVSVPGPLGTGPDRTWGHITVSNTLTDPFAGRADRGYIEETAADRMLRLAAEESIPLSLLGNPGDTVRLGPQPRSDIITLLQSSADADGGILAETRFQPGLLYRTRSSMLAQPPRITLDAAGTPAGIERPLDMLLDDQQIRNDVTASRTGGSSVRIVDQQHIDDHGRYQDQFSLDLAYDEQLFDAAGWQIHLGTFTGMRYPGCSPALDSHPDLIGTWHSLDLGDILRIIGLPSQHPPGPVDLMVQGESMSVSPTFWDAQVNTTPGTPWQTGVIGEGANGTGRYDSSRSYLAAAVDDTDITLQVVVPVQRSQIPNSGLETDNLSSFEVAGGAMERSSEQAFTGRWSLQFIPSSGVSSRLQTVIAANTDFALGNYGGFTYHYQVWAYTDGTGVDVRQILYFATETLDSAVTLPTGQWTRLHGTLVSPNTFGPSTGSNLIRTGIVMDDDDETSPVWLDLIEAGLPGQPWVDTTGHPSEFPFSIVVGGERMTVTAATDVDAENVQELTVTRGIEGPAVSHAAGQDVRLHTPLRFAP